MLILFIINLFASTLRLRPPPRYVVALIRGWIMPQIDEKGNFRVGLCV
jgi:hypothetical protein